MDRRQLPWALIGSGPCLSDIEDPVSLVENRQIMVINEAMKSIPAPDYVFLTEHHAMKYYFSHLDEASKLVCMKRDRSYWQLERNFLVRNGGRHIEEPIYVNKHYPQECGSMGRALAGLVIDFGVREFEIYGVDLDPERIKARSIRRMQLERLHEMTKEFDLKITNCCPSSVLEGFPFESRPWTTKEVMYEDA